jgi:hypothetical protein
MGRLMQDVDGPRIANALYDGVFKGDSEYITLGDIEYALDAAVCRLRSEVKDPM